MAKKPKMKAKSWKPHGFVIAFKTTLAAPPTRVWDALTKHIGRWWSFTLGGENSLGVELDPRIGGLFLEKWKGGGGSLFGTVTEAAPGKRLEIMGTIGYAGATHGKVGIDLKQGAKGETIVKFRHSVYGEINREDAKTLADEWNRLINSVLRKFVEKARG